MTEEAQLQIARGIVRAVYAQKRDSGWGVCKLQQVDGRGLSLTGVLPFTIEAGDTIEAIGAMHDHPQYGEQFKSIAVVLHLPGKALAREQWLRNIEALTAHDRLELGRLGGRLWEALEKRQLDRLELSGDGRRAVVSAYADLAEVRESFLALLGFGFSEHLVGQLVSTFRGEAMRELKDNPYLPFIKFPVTCPFKLIDQIAREHFGVVETDARRVDAVMVDVLKKELQSGHCYGVLFTMAAKCAPILGLDAKQIADIIVEAQRSVIVEGHRVALGYVVDWERRVADVAGELAAKVAADTEFSSTLARVSGIELDDAQARAVQMLLSSPISVVTGAAGTGKTTILQEAVSHLGSEVALCAPTGKAARRITEATGFEATTIHRLLEADHSGNFGRNADNPLEAAVVICDESSMLSIDIAEALLSATIGRVAFVGDVHQLPPVGPGQFLRDLIDSEVVPVARLQAIHRAARESWVYQNAPLVLDGGPVDLEEHNDFVFYELGEDEADRLTSTTVNVVKKLYERGAKPGDIQVLTGPHAKAGGRLELNQALQQALNPRQSLAWKLYGSDVRVGDVVVQTKNNYDLEVFNGELGVVVKINDKELVVQFQDHKKFTTYTHWSATQLDLAYALTIHRFQGSQVDTAVVVCHSSQSKLLRTRQLFYTAITRAKKKVVVIGDRRGVVDAIRNDHKDVRRTTLIERLRARAGAA